MSFGVNPAKNMEVFTSGSFSRAGKVDSRPVLSEKISRIDSVEMSLEDNFAKIEELAHEDIDEARTMSKSVLLQSEYFYKVAGIKGNEMQQRLGEIEKLFNSYFANLQAALAVLNEKLEFEKDINGEIEEAQTPEDFKNLQNIKMNEASLKMKSYKRMYELYHLAESKILEMLNAYFPRKNTINKIAA